MWHLLGATPRREPIAEASLRDQGFNTYLPVDKEGPLFPGYLFCDISDEDTETIHKSPYVWLIRFGEVPAVVPDKVIDGLRETAWHRSDKCEVGKKVRTNDLAGRWADIEAIVHAKSKDRIILLVDLMNKQTKLVLPIRAVEAA